MVEIKPVTVFLGASLARRPLEGVNRNTGRLRVQLASQDPSADIRNCVSVSIALLLARAGVVALEVVVLAQPSDNRAVGWHPIIATDCGEGIPACYADTYLVCEFVCVPAWPSGLRHAPSLP